MLSASELNNIEPAPLLIYLGVLTSLLLILSSSALIKLSALSSALSTSTRRGGEIIESYLISYIYV